jgi:hypothetical protein
MSNLGIAFYVVGALFTLYIIAASWRSKDADPQDRAERPSDTPRR